MKLAIIGSRTFDNFAMAFDAFKEHYPSGVTEIVSGGAVGADTIGREIANSLNIPIKEFLPDWKTFGDRAGFIRNQQIIDACDEVLAFWDGVSRGTKHSMDLARQQGKRVVIVLFVLDPI